MEPLMTYEGYQIIENSNKSNDLLNNYYEQMGYKISEPERKVPANTGGVIVENAQPAIKK